MSEVMGAPAEMPRRPALSEQLESATLSGLAHDETLTEVELNGLELPGQRARGVSLRSCRVSATDLSGSYLEQFGLSEVELRGCNLANLQGPRSSFFQVTIGNCRMTGLALSGALLRDVTIRDSRVDLASFGSSRLQRVTFEDCRLAQSDFLESTLDSVRFHGCDLTEADFRGARLHRCEWRDCDLSGLLGVDRLTGSAMPWPDIVGNAGLWAQALGIDVLDADS